VDIGEIERIVEIEPVPRPEDLPATPDPATPPEAAPISSTGAA